MPKTYSTAEFAKELGLSIPSFKTWKSVNKNKLPKIKFEKEGRNVLYPNSYVESAKKLKGSTQSRKQRTAKKNQDPMTTARKLSKGDSKNDIYILQVPKNDKEKANLIFESFGWKILN